MADIRFPCFGSRQRRAGGNAAAFGSDEQSIDEMLQEDEGGEKSSRREHDAPLLRHQLHGYFADARKWRIIEFFTFKRYHQRFAHQTNRIAAFDKTKNDFNGRGTFRTGYFAV